MGLCQREKKAPEGAAICDVSCQAVKQTRVHLDCCITSVTLRGTTQSTLALLITKTGKKLTFVFVEPGNNLGSFT